MLEDAAMEQREGFLVPRERAPASRAP